MKPWKVVGTSAALALISTQVAFADISADQLWQNWRNHLSASGSKFDTGAIQRHGDTLIITDLTIHAPDSPSKIKITLAELRFRDTGDGRVEITLADTANFAATAEGGVEMTATAEMPGMITVASGSAEVTTYALTLPEFALALASEETEYGHGKMTLTATKGVGTYSLAGPPEAPVLDAFFTSATLGLIAELREKDSSIRAALSLADPQAKVDGTFAGLGDGNVAAALAAGFAYASTLSFGAISAEIDVVDENGPAKILGGSQAGHAEFGMDAAKMRLFSTTSNAAFSLSGGAIPFSEITLTCGECALGFALPMLKSDEPAEFTALTKFVDFGISDNVWGMLDPTGVLPHDPATLIADITGRTRVTAEYMDETVKEALGNASPFELHALTIAEIRAKIAGADLTGTGDFTFDNNDLETYGGVPAPTGRLELSLSGGNTLLGNLVEMGLLSDSDALPARLMFSMFARPGEGEDMLTSTLEFKDKHFFANGQQLQ